MRIQDLKRDALIEYDKMMTQVSNGSVLVDPFPIVYKMQMINFLETEAVQTNYESSIVEYFISNVDFKK